MNRYKVVTVAAALFLFAACSENGNGANTPSATAVESADVTKAVDATNYIKCKIEFIFKKHGNEKLEVNADIIYDANNIVDSSIDVVHIEHKDGTYAYGKWTDNSVIENFSLKNGAPREPALIFENYDTRWGLTTINIIALPYPFKYDSNGNLLVYYGAENWRSMTGLANLKEGFSVSCAPQ